MIIDRSREAESRKTGLSASLFIFAEMERYSSLKNMCS